MFHDIIMLYNIYDFKKNNSANRRATPSSKRRNSRGGLSVKVGILRATGIASDDKVIILAIFSLELIGFPPEVSLLDFNIFF